MKILLFQNIFLFFIEYALDYRCIGKVLVLKKNPATFTLKISDVLFYLFFFKSTKILVNGKVENYFVKHLKDFCFIFFLELK